MQERDINSSIGARLKKLRTERQLTLESLSELTGVSVSMLSAIERGRKSPTLTILNRINSGMKISLQELFDDTRDDDCRIIPREEMQHIQRNAGGDLWMLFTCNQCKRFEVMQQQMPPHSTWESIPHGSGVWEYCMIVRGDLTIEVSGKRYVVREGEAFSFMAKAEHSYFNEGDEPLDFIIISASR